MFSVNPFVPYGITLEDPWMFLWVFVGFIVFVIIMAFISKK